MVYSRKAGEVADTTPLKALRYLHLGAKLEFQKTAEIC